MGTPRKTDNSMLPGARPAAALFLACHLAFYYVGPVYAAAYEGTIAADCEKMQRDSNATMEGYLQNMIPKVDPSLALSKLSCLDQILSTKISFAAFLNLDSLIDQWISRYVNRLCNAAQSSWDRLMGDVTRSIGVNVQLPYGAGGIQVGPNTAGSGSAGSNVTAGGPLQLRFPGAQPEPAGLIDNIKAFWARLWS